MRKVPRISAYSRPSPDGKGVIVDVEGMLVDAIMIVKGTGGKKDEYLAHVARVWDEVDVQITLPKSGKH